MHIIGNHPNEVIVLETIPPVYFYVSPSIIAIPGKEHILPQFQDISIRIGGQPLDSEWGWSRHSASGIIMDNYRGWYTWYNIKKGVEILNRIKEVYDRNMKRR